MAQKNSGFTNELKANIKPSNTGHAFDPARKAPLSAKDSVYLGGEQTSDGAAVEKRIADSRNSSDTASKDKNLDAKGNKKRDANLKPHLPKH